MILRPSFQAWTFQTQWFSYQTVLPIGATKQHVDAQKLLNAFPKVISELEKRSIALGSASQNEVTASHPAS